jgi:type 1 glutamine amidotransferase
MKSLQFPNGLVWTRPVLAAVVGITGSAWAFSSCAQAAPPTADDIAKIRAAAPAKAVARPLKARRVLLYTRATRFVHSSRETAAEALKIIGEKTGAWTAVISDDPVSFEDLSSFDAIVFANTTGAALLPNKFNDLPEAEKTAARERETRYKANLMAFVKGGKGFAGIHSATDTYWEGGDDWPEFRQMIGGSFLSHPWNAGDDVTVNVDDATSPIVAHLGGQPMSFKEEMYQFREPFSRQSQRVLMTLDLEKSQKKDGANREDRDYAVTWIKPHGAGRVFYTSLGHREDMFQRPQVLALYLSGIQYALGDLKADSTPIALAPPEYADAVMGEYAAPLSRARNAHQVLARVIPEGKESYRAVIYWPDTTKPTANPLDSAMRGRRIELTGTLKDAAVEFSGRDGEADVKAFWRPLDGLTQRHPGPFALTQLSPAMSAPGLTTIPMPELKRVAPSLGQVAPRGAVALIPYETDARKRLAGPSLSEWKNPNWIPMRDGSVQVKGGDNVTKREFGDIRLHVEFMSPLMPEARGQQRGNSGVYLQERYEVQVLDSFGLDSKDNDAGGIYKVAKPPVNASLPPGKWQAYDILFRAPRLYTDGSVAKFGRVTVIHNGIMLHNNIEIPQTTGGGASGFVARAPLKLQDHGDRVRYRNLWVQELTDQPWTPVANPKPDPNAGQKVLFDGKSLDAWAWAEGKNAPAIEEGAIAINKSGELWTKNQYENFVMDFEWKTEPGGNSGVFIRNPKPGDWFAGMEIQVEDSFGKPTTVHTAGGNYDVLAPTKNMAKPAGEWNTMRITANGPNIQVELNGEKVVDQDLNRWAEAGKNPDGSNNKFKTAYKDMPRRGHIELQDHGQRVWYRNIKIRELK